VNLPPTPTYDGLLLVSFGGPEGPDDVVPFLENVTHGRGIPRERLEAVGQHYFRFGGVSPINEQNRRLLAALRAELPRHGVDLPVYWGNRNWAPYLPDTVDQMRADGVTRALAFFTSAYSSYSGCRQYRENLADALGADDAGLHIERLGPYFNHPGFVEPFVDSTLAALSELPDGARPRARLVFTTHSIPMTMAETSGVPGGAYVRQHLEVAQLVADAVAERTGTEHEWDLVYQSRSGAPQVPWLEPDVGDHLAEMRGSGASGAVVVPIGFVSDHMEVVWDLDTEAADRARELGLPMVRAATPGNDPRFVAMVGQLVRERQDGIPMSARQRLGALGPAPDSCLPGCCPNPRAARPAIGDEDLTGS
jgi:ferrochelatase